MNSFLFDDRDGCQFTAAVATKPAAASGTGLSESTRKTTRKILEFLFKQPPASRQEIADVLESHRSMNSLSPQPISNLPSTIPNPIKSHA